MGTSTSTVRQVRQVDESIDSRRSFSRASRASRSPTKKRGHRESDATTTRSAFSALDRSPPKASPREPKGSRSNFLRDRTAECNVSLPSTVPNLPSESSFRYFDFVSIRESSSRASFRSADEISYKKQYILNSLRNVSRIYAACIIKALSPLRFSLRSMYDQCYRRRDRSNAKG